MFFSRLIPRQIRLLLMFGTAIVLFGGLSFAYWILTVPADTVQTSLGPGRSKEVKPDQQTLPPVPPASVGMSLDKRLRHMEMPITESIVEQPEAAAAPPLSSLPSLNAELVATFVETPIEKSYAVFRVPGQPDQLFAVGQSIDQAGEKFVVVSVDRRSVTLDIRGNSMTISMKE